MKTGRLPKLHVYCSFTVSWQKNVIAKVELICTYNIGVIVINKLRLSNAFKECQWQGRFFH